jgi:hypothetical protein
MTSLFEPKGSRFVESTVLTTFPANQLSSAEQVNLDCMKGKTAMNVARMLHKGS